MGMTRSWGALVCLVVVWMATPACSSDEGGTGGSGAGVGSGGTTGGGGSSGGLGVTPRPGETESRDAFFAAYAGAVCVMFRPCCEGAAKGFDAVGCEGDEAKTNAVFHPGIVDAAKAKACLDAVRAAASDPNRCVDLAFPEATFEALCDEAIVPDPSIPSPAGKACTKREDCAAGGGAYADCELGLCRVYTKGKEAGIGPCELRKDADPPDTTIYQCDPASGVYCQRERNVCEPFVADGGTCPVTAACGPGGMCIGGTCRTKPSEGQACLNAIPGAGGFCADGFVCNKQLLVCEARPKNDAGTKCNSPEDCKSNQCDLSTQTCKAYDFSKYLSCTG